MRVNIVELKRLISGEVIKGKPLSPESLRAARAIAALLPGFVSELRGLPIRELVKHKDKVFAASDALEICFVFNSPAEVAASGSLLQEWEAVLDSIPDNAWADLSRMTGDIAKWLLAGELMDSANTDAAKSRWSRLESVKEWAFEKRATNPEGTRAALIKRIRAEVRERAKIAGEPLTGDDEAVFRTITGWFRKAGIK